MSPTRNLWKSPIAAAGIALIVCACAVGGEESTTGAKNGGLALRDVDEGALGVFEGDRPVLVYNHGVRRREGVDEHYFRSGYVHPLYGLDGEVLTDDFPKDHYHHRGVFWAWPGVETDGKKYDIWTLIPGIRSRFERFGKREANGDRAVLEVENGWYTGEKKVMREDVRIIVHPAAKDSRAIDFELAWTPVGAPMTLWGAAGKSYGGMTIRFAPREKPVITVPSGPTEKDLTVAQLEWDDYTGKFPDAPERSGAAIFIHPSHPDFPPTWLTRQYGCLCVGWPGVEPQTFAVGKTFRCVYRVWVHRGNPDAAAIERAFQKFAESGAEKTPAASSR